MGRSTSHNNVVTVYGHAQGLVYEKGYETIGWANAEAQYEQVGTKNTLVVMNYDRKEYCRYSLNNKLFFGLSWYR